MRRGIKPDRRRKPFRVDAALGWEVLREDGGDERRGRALALSAGDMDRIQAIEVRGLWVERGTFRSAAPPSSFRGHNAHLVTNAAHPINHVGERMFVGAGALLTNGLDNGKVALQAIERRHGSVVVASGSVSSSLRQCALQAEPAQQHDGGNSSHAHVVKRIGLQVDVGCRISIEQASRSFPVHGPPL